MFPTMNECMPRFIFSAAQASPQDSVGQEESDAVKECNNIKDFRKLHYPRRRLSAIWQ